MFVLVSTDPNIKQQPDPIEPNIYQNVGNDSIKAVTQMLSWEEAKKRCESDKANLGSLRNEWTNAYAELLASTLKTPLWIGLNKNKVKSCSRLKFLHCRWKTTELQKAKWKMLA